MSEKIRVVRLSSTQVNRVVIFSETSKDGGFDDLSLWHLKSLMLLKKIPYIDANLRSVPNRDLDELATQIWEILTRRIGNRFDALQIMQVYIDTIPLNDRFASNLKAQRLLGLLDEGLGNRTVARSLLESFVRGIMGLTTDIVLHEEPAFSA